MRKRLNILLKFLMYICHLYIITNKKTKVSFLINFIQRVFKGSVSVILSVTESR